MNGSFNTFNCSRSFYTDDSGNSFSNYTRLSFNTTEGNINVDFPPIGSLTTQSVAKITSQLSSQFLPAFGGTMTGALKLPANGLLAGTNQLALAGGKVGIGTSNPLYMLDVAGDANISGYLRGASWGFGGMFQKDDHPRHINDVVNPLTNTIGCPSGFNAYGMGRVWAPESKWGAWQYVCIR